MISGRASSIAPRSNKIFASPRAASRLSGSFASASRNPCSASATSPVASSSAASFASISASVGRIESRNRSISSDGIAPMNMLTGCPSRKATTVGMLWERTAWSSALPTRLASTSILASVNAPARLVAASSSIGPRVRQGPHQAAQRSTTTGAVLDPSTTTWSKVSSVTSITDVPSHPCYGLARGTKRRSRSAFATTLTLEAAIAAAAHIGSITPTTARGIITTL